MASIFGVPLFIHMWLGAPALRFRVTRIYTATYDKRVAGGEGGRGGVSGITQGY